MARQPKRMSELIKQGATLLPRMARRQAEALPQRGIVGLGQEYMQSQREAQDVLRGLGSRTLYGSQGAPAPQSDPRLIPTDPAAQAALGYTARPVDGSVSPQSGAQNVIQQQAQSAPAAPAAEMFVPYAQRTNEDQMAIARGEAAGARGIVGDSAGLPGRPGVATASDAQGTIIRQGTAPQLQDQARPSFMKDDRRDFDFLQARESLLDQQAAARGQTRGMGQSDAQKAFLQRGLEMDRRGIRTSEDKDRFFQGREDRAYQTEQAGLDRDAALARQQAASEALMAEKAYDRDTEIKKAIVGSDFPAEAAAAAAGGAQAPSDTTGTRPMDIDGDGQATIQEAQYNALEDQAKKLGVKPKDAAEMIRRRYGMQSKEYKQALRALKYYADSQKV